MSILAAASIFVLFAMPLCVYGDDVHACIGIDCGRGVCFERGNSRYVCICDVGYEGENCLTPHISARDAANRYCENIMPCQNDSTCIEISPDDDAPVDEEEGESPLDMNGEAEMDDMTLQCGVEENCYTCLCAPGFTGVNCSNKIGLLLVTKLG